VKKLEGKYDFEGCTEGIGAEVGVNVSAPTNVMLSVLDVVVNMEGRYSCATTITWPRLESGRNSCGRPLFNLYA